MPRSLVLEVWHDRQLWSHLKLAAILAVGIWQPPEAALHREVSSSFLFAKPQVPARGQSVMRIVCVFCAAVTLQKAIRPAVSANTRSPIILLAVGQRPRATNSRSSSELTYTDTKPLFLSLTAQTFYHPCTHTFQEKVANRIRDPCCQQENNSTLTEIKFLGLVSCISLPVNAELDPANAACSVPEIKKKNFIMMWAVLRCSFSHRQSELLCVSLFSWTEESGLRLCHTTTSHSSYLASRAQLKRSNLKNSILFMLSFPFMLVGVFLQLGKRYRLGVQGAILQPDICRRKCACLNRSVLLIGEMSMWFPVCQRSSRTARGEVIQVGPDSTPHSFLYWRLLTVQM